MAELSRDLGNVEYDKLLAGPRDWVKYTHNEVAQGENKLKRGCLVTYDAATKTVKACKLKADVVYGILAEDVDATSSKVYARIYLSGAFNEEALSMGTPGDSGKVADFYLSARNVGIIFNKPTK
ncbi:Uncharacterised protein [Anaerobiospirillum thomasii]|uniref:Bacteriophage lambda head decoration protein D n=1 Tax=Anaerobiospirillum thomasii TaxID=179995 RepID=A0A2X0VGN4_9GAMM|nr:hypothetical protein [Anaerobiospirillum thomasii]SPT67640.1 Uncharacterised protein [Anaerobiospirillum thomasii]SPT68735.1 Uncharacterised protein [Anaerobiospirillum thomasii]SPT70100.1 Uncharacterised protein [Anaerobiospirillum thomasii]SPT72426.1 Uncharacterised protein [Anaerobiospirillum thomasii]